MSNRYNGLEHNLAALQDLIKRDADSYRDEFLEQYRHYENTLKLFQLQPDLDSSHLIEVVSFLSHVAHCYPQETKQLSTDLIQILSQNGQLLDPHLRMSLCKCLVILRNKGLSDSIEILKLFFELAKCRDKALRKFIFESTVAYAKFLLMKKNCPKLISAIQAFIFSKLNETYAVTCRLALLICVDLYRRRVWQDAKTANMIGRACLHRVTKIYVTACKFFLGKDMFDEKEGGESSDDDDKDDGKPQRSIKEIMVGYRAAKKTRKKQKQLEKAKENLQKVESKQKSKSNKLKQLDFSAFHYLYDPQDFVEKLFKKLEKCNDRFEVKIMLMALIARAIGIHKLQLLSFYPYLQKYARPSQRDVTKILLFAAQATHDLVPPDVIQLLIKTIVNNFISDRCSSEAITVGLNTVREIVEKCPLAIDQDLLDDLVEYKKYKNKNVSMAAKGIIQVFRDLNPDMLKKRDRGRPTEHSKTVEAQKYFGENRAVKGFVPGAEVFLLEEAAKRKNDEESKGEEHDGEECDSSDGDDEEEFDWSENDEENEEESATTSEKNNDQEQKDDSESAEKRVTFAQNISETRIFTQEDFKKMQNYQLKQKLVKAKGKKRKAEEAELEASLLTNDEDELGVEDNDDDDDDKPEITRLRDIEHLHKRPKQDKAARLETIMAGREGREKFGRPKRKGSHVGRTNKNLAKRKAFTMVKQKQRGKSKKRSFRDKQRALRNYLINQKKMR